MIQFLGNVKPARPGCSRPGCLELVGASTLGLCLAGSAGCGQPVLEDSEASTSFSQAPLPAFACERPLSGTVAPTQVNALTCSAHEDCAQDEFCGKGVCRSQLASHVTMCLEGLSVEGELPAGASDPPETEVGLVSAGNRYRFEPAIAPFFVTGRRLDFGSLCAQVNPMDDGFFSFYTPDGVELVTDVLPASGHLSDSKSYWFQKQLVQGSSEYSVDPVGVSDFWLVDTGCFESVIHEEAWDGSLTAVRVVLSAWYP